MDDINTANLAKSLISFVSWFPDTQINNTDRDWHTSAYNHRVIQNKNKMKKVSQQTFSQRKDKT